MLFLEIILTIFAWRKGWRWWALVPVGICLLIGFIIGFLIGANGGSVNDIGAAGWIFDVGAIIALIFMLCIKPQSKIDEEEELAKAAKAKKVAETPKSV